MTPFLIVLKLIALTGPGGQDIEINKDQVVSIREPRDSEQHFHKDVRCLIHLTDGKFVAVTETCAIVRQLLESEVD